MSSLFVIPLFFLSFLFLAVGAYDIHRGENLAEGEMVGGWGTYWDRTGFLIRGTIATVFGIFFLIFAIVLALST